MLKDKGCRAIMIDSKDADTTGETKTIYYHVIYTVTEIPENITLKNHFAAACACGPRGLITSPDHYGSG